jgi:uroporphyrinogen-III synthase
MIEWNLKGKRIAVPEMRELEVLSALLERRGAVVLRCPLVNIYDSPHSAQVLAFAVHLADGGFDDFLLITGEGLTRILSCIDKYDPPLRARFVEGLSKLRTVTRGPKPARALRALGLKPAIEATEPTTEGVIEMLGKLDLKGHRLGLQLYPDKDHSALTGALAAQGAEVDSVLPYAYDSKAADANIVTAIDDMAEGRIDSIALTNLGQVRRLIEAARAHGSEAKLRAGLERTLIASVGPAVSGELTALGLRTDVSPADEAYFMRPLISAMATALAERKPRPAAR